MITKLPGQGLAKGRFLGMIWMIIAGFSLKVSRTTK